jgi:hypothetical protein
MVKSGRLKIFLILALLLVATFTHSEYYTYVDSDGNTHFTDNPSSIPAKELKKFNKVDVDMSPEKKAPTSTTGKVETVESGSWNGSPQMKRAKKTPQMQGVPSSRSGGHSNMDEQPQQLKEIETTGVTSDPALNTPLKTIRHFRRSLASFDYSEAAKCLGVADTKEVQGFMSQIPKDFALKLSSEFAEAVEIYRDKETAIYSIGDQKKGGNKILQRNDIQLHKYGPNWYISH